jgi:hypothetical protein
LVGITSRRFARDVPAILLSLCCVLLAVAVWEAPLSPSWAEVFSNLEFLLAGGAGWIWFMKRTRQTCDRCDFELNTAMERRTLQREKRNLALAASIMIASLLGTAGRAWYVRRGPSPDDVARSIEDGTIVTTLGFDKLNPYQFYQRAMAGRHSNRGAAQGAAVSVRRSEPGSALEFDLEAAVDDLGTAMRFVVGYEGQLRRDGKLLPVVGGVRQYFHADGEAIIEVTCLKAQSNCSEMQSVVQSAEASVMKKLAGSGVGGVLLQGDCDVSTEENPITGLSHDTASCWYEQGTSVSLRRLNLGETRQAFKTISRDPEFKAMMKQLVESAR